MKPANSLSLLGGAACKRIDLNHLKYILQYKNNIKIKQRIEFYERALRYLPGCYKIWLNYLQESIESV